MTSTRGEPARQLVNLRDVGRGVGEQYVRAGLLWRSEAPHAGDAAPAGVGWPPRTVIDLRGAHELGEGGHPLVEPGTELVELPLLGALSPEEQANLRAQGITLPMLYDRLLDSSEAWLPRLVAVAASSPAPLLVHCAAGKDRTGVSVALLLALLDVPRDAIVADYLATGDVLDELLPRLDVDDELLDSPLVGVDDEAIARVLDRVGPDAEAFHRARGVAATDIAAWRRRARPGGA